MVIVNMKSLIMKSHSVVYPIIFFALSLFGVHTSLKAWHVSSVSLPTSSVSPQRVREIAALLPDVPQGIGHTYTDRAYWDKMRKDTAAVALLKKAPELLKQGMPPFVDSLYLHLNKTNVRLPGEIMVKARFDYITKLTLAECLENEGRYLPAIEQALISMCHQKPWSIPAHDRSLQNFYGTDYYVDLVVATSGNGLAQCVWMLADRLSPKVKEQVLEAFREKMFHPIRRCLERGKPFWWLNATNNWNSVCLAGVTGAALALLPSKEERAYFVAVAEKYHVNGMKGYADDGYCSEGVGYYNYGFRAYILLREEVCRATGGQIDFFRHPKFVRVARYSHQIQMQHGVCPAYSDTRIGLKVEDFISRYCDLALGKPHAGEKLVFPFTGHNNNFPLYALEMFPNPATKIQLTDEIKQALQEESSPLRSQYQEAGIFVARPVEGASCRMAISIKGGHNAENHNHNDVGSYAVSLGEVTIAGDQGGPFSYPGDYFAKGAPDKYPIKGSWGHPVPVVNGTCQGTGARFKAEIVANMVTAATDSLVFDLKAAYPVPELTQLQRTAVYSREGKGSFCLEDRFAAEKPVTFGTALTTAADWKRMDATHCLLSLGGEKLKVTVQASGEIEWTEEIIELNSPAYTRIGIQLKKNAPDGYIRLIMEPVE